MAIVGDGLCETQTLSSSLGLGGATDETDGAIEARAVGAGRAAGVSPPRVNATMRSMSPIVPAKTIAPQCVPPLSVPYVPVLIPSVCPLCARPATRTVSPLRGGLARALDRRAHPV